MKKIVAIVKPSKVTDVIEGLEKAGLTGATLMEVRGYGRQYGHSELYEGAPYISDFLPKVMIEVVVRDDLADAALETLIKSARTGRIGDGKIFISKVEQAVHIRTGEVGEEAI